MFNSELTQSVEQFANLTYKFLDAQLEHQWAWQSYSSEGIRFSFFRTYEELRELAVRLRAERTAQARPLSPAQLILAQYQAAYWDLQAALLGIEKELLDQSPAEGEWSVHKIYAHILGADLGFFVVINAALEKLRRGDMQPVEITDKLWKTTTGLDETEYTALMTGPFDALRDYHNILHARILQEFASITDAELDLLSRYWEKELMTIRFRLHRFDSHMRQHTIHLDKIRLDLGQSPTEAQRLLRLIYSALAEVNGAIIGAWEVGTSSQLDLAQTILARAEELARLSA